MDSNTLRDGLLCGILLGFLVLMKPANGPLPVAGVVVLGSYFLGNGDFDLPDPPLFAVFGVILYGIAANVCFTGGWLTELAVRKVWPDEADRFATFSFSLGLIFSVLLTLSPGILLGIAGIFALLGHLFGIKTTVTPE